MKIVATCNIAPVKATTTKICDCKMAKDGLGYCLCEKPGWAEHRAWGPGSSFLLRRVGTGNKSHISSLRWDQQNEKAKFKLTHDLLGGLAVRGSWISMVYLIVFMHCWCCLNPVLLWLWQTFDFAGHHIHVRWTPLCPSTGQVLIILIWKTGVMLQGT